MLAKGLVKIKKQEESGENFDKDKVMRSLTKTEDLVKKLMIIKSEP